MVKSKSLTKKKQRSSASTVALKTSIKLAEPRTPPKHSSKAKSTLRTETLSSKFRDRKLPASTVSTMMMMVLLSTLSSALFHALSKISRTKPKTVVKLDMDIVSMSELRRTRNLLPKSNKLKKHIWHAKSGDNPLDCMDALAVHTLTKDSSSS